MDQVTSINLPEERLSPKDLHDLLRLHPALRFAHILALNAKPTYANRLNVVELVAWLDAQEGEADLTLAHSAGSSQPIPASSGEAG